MSRHFCCCIPVRVAVFVSSLLTFLLSAIAAAASIFVLIKDRDENHQDEDIRIVNANLTTEQRTIFIIVAVIYSLVALISLFGFIGSIMRKRSFVAAYSMMNIAAFVLQTGFDIYFLYSLFRKDSKLRCTNFDDNTEGTCHDVLRDVRWISLATMVIVWLIQLYLVIVINRYVKQLDEEQSYDRAARSVDSAFNMGPAGKAMYYPHQPLEQDKSLLGPEGHYQYTDPHHSFGSHA